MSETLGKWLKWARQQSSFVYEGWLVSAPFKCMCCGVETAPEQWAYGRTCGPCDAGLCQRVSAGAIAYTHAEPPWMVAEAKDLRPTPPAEVARIRAEGMSRYAEGMSRYMEHVGANRITTESKTDQPSLIV